MAGRKRDGWDTIKAGKISKILFAVKSCHAYKHRADAQRATWVPDVKGADLRFFLGRGPDDYVPQDDEVILDCGDGYLDLPAKAVATFRWALERDYEWLCHLDDDVYARPERLLASGFEKFDYVGRLRGPSGSWPSPYCSGFAYWLSRRAMETVIRAEWTGDTADDRGIGNILHQAGLKGQLDERYRVTKCDQTKIPGQKGHTREDQMVGDAVYSAGLHGHADYRYAVIASPNQRNTVSSSEPPLQANDIIAACEFEPEEMLKVHQAFWNARATPRPRIPEGSLSKVNVLIKTYLRDGLLNKTIAGIQKNLRDVKMVIVDDGFETSQKIALYGSLRELGHICLWLPRDSGFGAKANLGVQACDRPYVLIASDDFDFADLQRKNPVPVRKGIEKMLAVLDAVPEIAVIAGRVDNHPYEFTLELGGDWCRARRGYSGEGLAAGVRYQFCDLTVNYCLVRREVFDEVHWDEPEPKIGGGEHSAWFIDLKRHGFRVAYIPGVNINQLVPTRTDIHPNYLLDRQRARLPWRPCLAKRGINHMVDETGACEQCGILCTRAVLRNTVTA